MPAYSTIGTPVIPTSTLSAGSEIVVRTVVGIINISDPAERVGYRIAMSLDGGGFQPLTDFEIDPYGVMWGAPFDNDTTCVIETIIHLVGGNYVIVESRATVVIPTAGYLTAVVEFPGATGLYQNIDLGSDVVVAELSLRVQARLPSNAGSTIVIPMSSILTRRHKQ